jgi:NAD(P)-dependent dehydrogenase (short-subunit alcohol dehydrogenase family)
MAEVEGKVAFITGGSSGIGLGIARAFTDAGMKVAIGYRTKGHLEEAMKVLNGAASRVHAISVDVTDRPGMEAAAAEVMRVFGKLHVLVNNAGVVHSAPLMGTSYEDWDWVINVNLTGVFNGVRAFLPLIRANSEGGHIIATSSIDGLISREIHPSYTASKFGVVGMMEALRAELSGENVGVSVYCPGWVKSNISDSSRNRKSKRASDYLSQNSAVTVASIEDNGDSDIPMDPFRAGQMVLQGMRRNNLYILTHPEFDRILRDRAEVLSQSNPGHRSPTERQMDDSRHWREDSIYARERRRIRCSQHKDTSASKD